MKLTSTRDVTGTLHGVERHKMSIAVNGKAFATLVKGIYSNPIRAFVREISTNALDGHTEAGIASKPFHVSFPDVLDPYFRVRDFGVSMDHDTVVNVFGTIFETTKDDSNDVVGAFGLGSKSPLSYADTFTVTAFLDGTERQYIISIDSDGTPLIDLMGERATDKPTGLEVAIPVKEHDFHRVAEEGRDVLRWFDVLPTATIDLTTVERIYTTPSGDAFVVKGERYGGNKVIVRQGCVTYPVDDYDIVRKVTHTFTSGYDLVIDVPIGTYMPIRSREGLELDEHTRADLLHRVETAVAEIRDDINSRLDPLPNRLAATEFLHTEGVAEFWAGGLKWRGRDVTYWIDLTFDTYVKQNKRGQRVLSQNILTARNGTSRQWHQINRIDIRHRDDYVFVIDRPAVSKGTVKRAMMRYRDAVNDGIDGRTDVRLLVDPDPRAIARAIRVAGFKPEQFVWVGNLPDPGPAPKGGAGRSNGAVVGVTGIGSWGHSLEVTELPADYYWVNIHRPTRGERSNAKKRYDQLVADGGDGNLPILVFSNAATEKIKPNPDRELRAAQAALFASLVDDIVEHAARHYAFRWEQNEEVTRKLYPWDDDFASKIDRLDSDAVERRNERVRELRAELSEKYPLLWEPTAADWNAYIAARDDELDNNS